MRVWISYQYLKTRRSRAGTWPRVRVLMWGPVGHPWHPKTKTRSSWISGFWKTGIYGPTGPFLPPQRKLQRVPGHPEPTSPLFSFSHFLLGYGIRISDLSFKQKFRSYFPNSYSSGPGTALTLSKPLVKSFGVTFWKWLSNVVLKTYASVMYSSYYGYVLSQEVLH